MDNLAISMQELGMENEVHLCKSCCHEYPSCDSKNLIFGTGVGSDNIASCESYEAITFRSPADRGDL